MCGLLINLEIDFQKSILEIAVETLCTFEVKNAKPPLHLLPLHSPPPCIHVYHLTKHTIELNFKGIVSR